MPEELRSAAVPPSRSRLLDGSEALRANGLNLISAPDGSGDQFVAISLSEVSGRFISGPGPADVPAD